MPEKDFAVGAIGVSSGVPSGAIYAGNVPAGSVISKKPCYLVAIESIAKTGKLTTKFYFALEKPDLQLGFIQAKGFFVDGSEDVIVASFVELAENTPKESILDMYFPASRVLYMRNLVFNANKQKSSLSQERK